MANKGNTAKITATVKPNNTTLNEIETTEIYSEGSTMLSNQERFPAAEEWLYVWNNSKYTRVPMLIRKQLYLWLDSQNV